MTLKDHGEPWADPIARVGRLDSRSVETRPSLSPPTWDSLEKLPRATYSCVKPSQLSRGANKFMPPMHKTRLMSKVAEMLAASCARETSDVVDSKARIRIRERGVHLHAQCAAPTLAAHG